MQISITLKSTNIQITAIIKITYLLLAKVSHNNIAVNAIKLLKTIKNVKYLPYICISL